MTLTSIQQLEDLGVVNDIGLRQEVHIMETNLIYLLDSGNILNMFEIQKY